MKHLKTYTLFEGVSKETKLFEAIIDKKSMGDAIRDILIDLEDEKFKITVYEPYEEEDEESEDEGNYEIHISRTDENREREFKWSEVKPSIEHLMNFAEENYFSPVVTVSISKPGNPKFPMSKKFVNSTFGKKIMMFYIKVELIDDGITDEDLEEDLYESVESNPNRWPIKIKSSGKQ